MCDVLEFNLGSMIVIAQDSFPLKRHNYRKRKGEHKKCGEGENVTTLQRETLCALARKRYYRQKFRGSHSRKVSEAAFATDKLVTNCERERERKRDLQTQRVSN